MNRSLLEIKTSSSSKQGADVFSLTSGEVRHFGVGSRESSEDWLDELLGLRAEREFATGVQWFGNELPRAESRAHYDLLQRVFVIVPGAPLLANISIAENILLPALARHVAKESSVGRELVEIVETWGEKLGLSFSDLTMLPHMVGLKQRLVAMVLQARLARPEVLILSDAALSWNEFWHLICEPCCWLRDAMPKVSWLFLNAESRLPPEFSSGNLPTDK